jgi:hypothetical protein
MKLTLVVADNRGSQHQAQKNQAWNLKQRVTNRYPSFQILQVEIMGVDPWEIN